MGDKQFVSCGALTAEIVGHKFHCDSNGKFKSRLDGYYCCRNAKSSVDIPLTLMRNPRNAYDSNAIEVHGLNGCMLGHLAKSSPPCSHRCWTLGCSGSKDMASPSQGAALEISSASECLSTWQVCRRCQRGEPLRRTLERSEGRAA